MSSSCVVVPCCCYLSLSHVAVFLAYTLVFWATKVFFADTVEFGAFTFLIGKIQL